MRAPLLLVLFLMTNGAAHAQASWTAFSSSGGQAPMPLLLDDLDGKAVDLASLKGQVVLINFWATWCDGCRAEIPAFNRLQQKFGARKLQIVGVNVAEGKPRIADFMQRIPIQFKVLRDPDMVVLKAWQVNVMPTTFLLDRNGMLRYQLVGEADWDDPKIQAPALELLK
ncbi:TlpA disulfide reductase family protein [Actimicrobium sp. GrIS 1.19]|uniref:TlpA disulfide reductase family protein n=1 Tax=Actimicrobium sp. GrIS 1.19 TaxID=3071708 RepID=UPI002E12C8F2